MRHGQMKTWTEPPFARARPVQSASGTPSEESAESRARAIRTRPGACLLLRLISRVPFCFLAHLSRLSPFSAAVRFPFEPGPGRRTSRRLRTSGLLTAGLAALAGHAWVEVALVFVECVRAIAHRGRRRLSLGLTGHAIPI